MPTPFRDLKQSTPGIGPLLMYILPLPLIVVGAKSLLGGNRIHLIGSLGSLILFWLSAWFLKQAHYYEWESNRRKWSRSTRFPWRMTAALFTGVGVFIVLLFLLNNNIFVCALGALLGYSGIILRYGFDPQFDKEKDATLVGTTAEELIEIFDEAENNLDELNAAAKKIQNQELKDRLKRITEKTKDILKQIEEDPKDLRRARKFLKVYLKGARRVATQYASSHPDGSHQELETNFRNVLVTIEEVIEEQRIKLEENNVLDLDVKIEVLEAQLRHEGVM